MYCTYKVRNSFNGKPGNYRLMLIVVTMLSKFVTTMSYSKRLPCIFYHKWYAKNGSHKLTAGFYMYGTYLVGTTHFDGKGVLTGYCC